MGAAALLLHGGGARNRSPLHTHHIRPLLTPLTTLATHQGNYPFESTYITYSVVPGKAYPLPAWPMRVACAGGYGGGGGLNADFGVKLTGSVADVKYSLALGDISVDVDWKTGTGNGDKLTEAQINASGVRELAAAVAAAAGVWHNLTKDVKCYNISNGDDATTAAPHPSEHDGPQDPHFVAPPAAAARRLEAAAAANDGVEAPATQAKSCPACPPCDDCPPCPVSFCDYEDDAPCTFTGELSRGFSWGGICCNDALSQIDITGVGRDFFWPPQVPARNSAQFWRNSAQFFDARPAVLRRCRRATTRSSRSSGRSRSRRAAAPTRRAASCAAAR